MLVVLSDFWWRIKLWKAVWNWWLKFIFSLGFLILIISVVLFGFFVTDFGTLTCVAYVEGMLVLRVSFVLYRDVLFGFALVTGVEFSYFDYLFDWLVWEFFTFTLWLRKMLHQRRSIHETRSNLKHIILCPSLHRIIDRCILTFLQLTVHARWGILLKLWELVRCIANFTIGGVRFRFIALIISVLFGGSLLRVGVVVGGCVHNKGGLFVIDSWLVSRVLFSFLVEFAWIGEGGLLFLEVEFWLVELGVWVVLLPVCVGCVVIILIISRILIWILVTHIPWVLILRYVIRLIFWEILILWLLKLSTLLLRVINNGLPLLL